ncbi:MAG: tetratricopeptide repeat protein [Desulfobacterales bacterium]|jgi:tetratricopeptide (TPR) repeat protein
MEIIPETLKTAFQQLNSSQIDRVDIQCRQVLQIDPHQADAHHLRGIIAYQRGKFDIAIKYLTKAIEKNPQNPEYHYHLGIVLNASGYAGKAVGTYLTALKLKPEHPAALNNLGLILYDQDKIDESILLFKTAVRSKPDFTNAYYNLGKAFQAQGNPQAAIAAYDQVLKILPDSAETRFNRSLSLLLTEKYEEGWVEYEQRFRNLNDPIKKWNKKDAHRWDGDSFVGKRLLVVDEQGIGDTLQFIRYLPMVKELGGTVIFETIGSLMRLLGNFQGIDELWNRSSVDRSDSAFDLYIPLMSLPGIFNTSLETIPDRVPYIFSDPTKTQFWRRQLKKGKINVGIVWKGKTTTEYRQIRVSGLEHLNLGWAGQPACTFASKRLACLDNFVPLTEIEGIQLYGLQKGNAADQARTISGSVNVINLCEESTDFSEVAAAMENLDLIISVDTALAHLAGAMGKPVWVLIPFVPDWRWLRVREDSPWYPTMKLFRQTKKNEWDDVFQRVAGELHALVHQ